jgi:hypothetical protein
LMFFGHFLSFDVKFIKVNFDLTQFNVKAIEVNFDLARWN